MQPELGPPPQDVLGGRSPLLTAQIVDLALVERRAEMPAEIAERLGSVEQPLGARAVAAGIMLGDGRRQPAMPLAELTLERSEVRAFDVTAGQWRRRRPRSAHGGKEGPEAVERLLRQATIGSDLAAEDRQQRRLARAAGELEAVVARDRRRVGLL